MSGKAKRRSPEEIAYDKLHVTAWQEHRAWVKAGKEAEKAERKRAWAEKCAERERVRQEVAKQIAEAAYLAGIAKDEAQAKARQEMMDGIDFISGNMTPGARAFGAKVQEKVLKVQAADLKVRVAGDLLNITKHTPPARLSKKAREKAKKEAKAKQNITDFHTPDGKKVTVDLRTNPLIGVYRGGQISAPQFAAAGMFYNDFEASNYSGMRSRGFEPGVDGGRAAVANLMAVDAQNRLARLREKLDPESYALMEAVICRSVTFTQIHEAGGEDVRTIGARLRDALNKAAIFYALQSSAPEGRTMKALQLLLKDMADSVGEHTN